MNCFTFYSKIHNNFLKIQKYVKFLQPTKNLFQWTLDVRHVLTSPEKKITFIGTCRMKFEKIIIGLSFEDYNVYLQTYNPHS